MSRKALIVYNPTARTIADPDVWLGKITHELAEKEDYVVTVFSTDSDKTPRDLLPYLTPAVDLVVAAGGDGTVGFALGAVALAQLPVPVGILPLGTINVLARNLGILNGNLFSNPISNAVNTILHGRPAWIDLGLMDGAYFAVTAGVGPLADIFVIPTRQEKTRFKILAYWRAMLHTLAAAPSVFEITTDQAKFTVLASGIFVSNVEDLALGRCNGNVDELTDGLLDLYVVNPRKFKDYLDLGFRFGHGLPTGNEPYYVAKIKQATIKVLPVRSPLSAIQRLRHKIKTRLSGATLSLPPRHKELPVMIDGDLYGTTPINVRVVPQAVNVLLPPAVHALISNSRPAMAEQDTGEVVSQAIVSSFFAACDRLDLHNLR